MDMDGDGVTTDADDYLAVYNGEQVQVPISAVSKEGSGAVRWLGPCFFPPGGGVFSAH